MKYLVLFTIFFYVWYFIGSASESSLAEAKHLRQYERQVAESSATANETTTLSPDDLLMRLKIYQYAEKLKIKEAKKKAKADKKKAKDAAFRAYLTSALAANTAAAAAPPSPAVGSSPGMAVPPMPMLPAVGLWKKSFLMAAAAAAMGTTTTTTQAPPPSDLEVTTDSSVMDASDAEDSAEDEVINQMVRRYAPIVREKFYGKNRKYAGGQKSEENSNEDPDAESEGSPSYKSGSFNKFGTGPAGSPNGVGYEKAKVNQAGCSGSNIHICSGTTIYLTNPEESAANGSNDVDAGVEEIMSRVQEVEEEVPESESQEGSQEYENYPKKSHKETKDKKRGHKNKH